MSTVSPSWSWLPETSLIVSLVKPTVTGTWICWPSKSTVTVRWPPVARSAWFGTVNTSWCSAITVFTAAVIPGLRLASGLVILSVTG